LLNLYGFGRNNKGQLGTGGFENKIIPNHILNSLFKIKQISTGIRFTIFLNEENKTFSFGTNDRGNL
jgi:alpha-tubulin suppressor-like RCC1 family protein